MALVGGSERPGGRKRQGRAAAGDGKKAARGVVASGISRGEGTKRVHAADGALRPFPLRSDEPPLHPGETAFLLRRPRCSPARPTTHPTSMRCSLARSLVLLTIALALMKSSNKARRVESVAATPAGSRRAIDEAPLRTRPQLAAEPRSPTSASSTLVVCGAASLCSEQTTERGLLRVQPRHACPPRQRGR